MLAGVLIAATILAGPPAEEKAAPAVLLITACPDAPAIGELADAVQAQLMARRHEVIRRAATGRTYCWYAERQQARGLLAEAKAAFERLEIERAKVEGDKALRVFTGAQSLLGDRGLYIEVRMLLGWISVELRERDAGRTHFAAAASVDPEFTPARHRYPPEVLEAYADAAAKQGRDRLTLQVTSDPAGATVRLDDRELCQAPCEVPGIAKGVHFIEAEIEGFAVQRRLLRALRTPTAAFTLERLADQGDGAVASARLELGPRDGTLIAARWSGLVNGARDVDGSAPSTAAAQVVAMLDLATTAALGAAPPAPAAATWREVVWPWGVVAGAVVVGAGVLAYGLTRPKTVEVMVTAP